MAERTENGIDSLLARSKADLIRIILEKEDRNIPLSVFTSGLHPLQAVVKYLKEIEKLPMRQIALLLNRDIQTVWTSYHQVQKKRTAFKRSPITIPLSILAKKDDSILEATVHYLHTVHQLTLTQIARTLNRSVKTIWTCNDRHDTKRERT